jgi:hypothetical protein
MQPVALASPPASTSPQSPVSAPLAAANDERGQSASGLTPTAVDVNDEQRQISVAGAFGDHLDPPAVHIYIAAPATWTGAAAPPRPATRTSAPSTVLRTIPDRDRRNSPLVGAPERR